MEIAKVFLKGGIDVCPCQDVHQSGPNDGPNSSQHNIYITFINLYRADSTIQFSSARSSSLAGFGPSLGPNPARLEGRHFIEKMEQGDRTLLYVQKEQMGNMLGDRSPGTELYPEGCTLSRAPFF